jgi:hypothetical protein
VILIHLILLAYFAALVIAAENEIRKDGNYTVAVFTALVTIATLWKFS